MTKLKYLSPQNLKIAAIIAIACIYASQAMGQRGGSDMYGGGGPPAREGIFGMGGTTATEPKTPVSKLQIRVYELQYSDAETTTRVLSNLLSGSDGIRFSVDRRRNALILTGTEELLQAASAILEKLDTPGPAEHKRTVPISVRVIWLVDGVENTAAPAENLKEVVEELRRQGLKNIGQLAQTMVRSQNNGQFQISSSPLLDNNTVTLSAKGAIQSESKLEVSISASAERAQGMGGGGRGGMGGGGVGPGPGGFNTVNLVNINVTTVYKTNEYIVLAVAPIGKITSAFVIQITEGKP
jgi:hypothetical protein